MLAPDLRTQQVWVGGTGLGAVLTNIATHRSDGTCHLPVRRNAQCNRPRALMSTSSLCSAAAAVVVVDAESLSSPTAPTLLSERQLCGETG